MTEGPRSGDRAGRRPSACAACTPGRSPMPLPAEALTSVLIGINRTYKVDGAGIRITGIARLERIRDEDALAPAGSRSRALDGMPARPPGDDLAGLLIAALERSGIDAARPGHPGRDAEDRLQGGGPLSRPRHAEPGARARELAADHRQGRAPGRGHPVAKSAEVLRAKPNVLIVETAHGLVMANAGIDQSNLERRRPRPPRAAAARRSRRQRRSGSRRGSTRISLPTSASSSPTASAAPGGSAPSASRSARPACRRCGTGAASRTCRAASSK